MNGLNPATGLDLPDLASAARPSRWTTPVRLRTLTALAVLIVFALAAVVSGAAGDLRSGLRRMGGRTAPLVLVAGDLRANLAELDASLAWTADADDRRGLPRRGQALARFDGALARTTTDLQRLAAIAEDPAARRQLETVVRALARYQALAGQLMLLGERAPWELRRQASDLMRLSMLPAAQRLGDAGARDLARVDQDARDDVGSARVAVVALGVALLVVLLALQLTLALRHRRLISVPLVLVTVLACVLIAASAHMLHAQDERLRPSGAPAAAVAQADALERWQVLPPVSAAILAGLVLAGIRPRLAEFR